MSGRSARLSGLALGVLATIGVSLCARQAGADGRVAFLSERLKYPPANGKADDFRVRTNAALALGSTNEDGAVSPLCAGLDDPSDAVRQGAAVGLRKLARAASNECLHRRSSVETSAAVKSELRRAIEAVDGAMANMGAASPTGSAATNAKARYYVAMSRVANHTSRSSSEIDPLVHDAIATELGKTGDYQLAPPSEGNDAAKAALKKHAMKGYYLAISVEKFEYSVEGLRVRVKVAVFSYPGKDLRGEVPAGATLPGAPPGDTAAENQLLGIVAGRAAELFSQNFR